MTRIFAVHLSAMALALAVASGCGPVSEAHVSTAEGSEAGTDAHAHHLIQAPSGAEAAPQGHSVYQLPGTWRDQTGTELELADLAGRPRVVAFVYTSCAFACPRIVARMKRIEAADPEVGLVLVSIDPARDTPERLAGFAEGSRLHPDRWTLLNGEDARIQELSVLLDVPWQAAGDEFAHANVLTLLDEDGVPVVRLEGLESELAPLLASLDAAGAAATGRGR